MTNKLKITDIELSKCFGDSVYENYKTALEFLTINSDYSLLKFRLIIEEFVQLIAKQNSMEFDSDGLSEQIRELYSSQLIYGTTKNVLHELRIVCNSVVHKGSGTIEDDTQDFAHEAKKKLLDKAKEARQLLVSLFEDVFIILKFDSVVPEVSLVEYETQEHRNILYEATTSMSSKMKLKAGILCQSLAENREIGGPLLVSTNVSYHEDFLFKLAGSFYEASFKLSADVDKWHDVSLAQGRLPSFDELILQHCTLEPLFRYALLAREGVLGESEVECGMKYMKIAADRGFIEAKAYYGAFLYEEEKFTDSKEYLEAAALHENVLALRFLFFYFIDGKVEAQNIEKGLQYLNRAIELGCADSIGTLGKEYHLGEIVDKDMQKAEELLRKAIDKGSHWAYRYYIIEYGELAQKVASHFQRMTEPLLNILHEKQSAAIASHNNKVSLKKKVRPNDPCPCGSGKKYKKCCKPK